MVMPPTIQVASLGMWDTLILMVLALVFFGPRRLPEISRKIGKIMYEIRKASNDFKFQMEEEFRNAEEAERRKKEEERLSALPASQQPAPVSPAPESISAAPAESPYPNGATYPAGTATTSDDPYPRILPPSTGEPVPAVKPGKQPAQARPPAAKKSPRAAKSATKAPAPAKKARKAPGRRS